MRVLLGLSILLAITACGPAVFNGESGSQKASGDASGQISQVSEAVAQMCADAGMVPKTDSCSDDDSASTDDDSVDGVSADHVSSDDDSSDDAACADTASCVAKKCEPAPASDPEPTAQ